jgi:hypothetical protein
MFNPKETQKNALVVEIRHVYGNERIYPVCGQAKGFAELIGVKSFTREQLSKIKGLGYIFEVKQAELTL